MNNRYVITTLPYYLSYLCSFYINNPDSFSAVVGETILSPNNDRKPISRIIVHDDYTGRDNDFNIALVQLSQVHLYNSNNAIIVYNTIPITMNHTCIRL